MGEAEFGRQPLTAVGLGSQNVQALTALGYTEALQYRNALSERTFKRAIAADSSFATAHFWYGLLLLQQMRNEDAHYLAAALYNGLRKDPRARALFARISAG